MSLPFVTTAQLERAVSEKQDKIEVTSADAGKMVSVNEQGELTLVPAPSGDIKLYNHTIQANGVYFDAMSHVSSIPTNLVELINLCKNAIKITRNAGLVCRFEYEYDPYPTLKDFYLCYVGSENTVVKDSLPVKYNNFTDTVTEL